MNFGDHKKDINYITGIIAHSTTQEERELGYDVTSRVQEFLSTKKMETVHTIINLLLQFTQEPPKRLSKESDTDYIDKYNKRLEKAQRYEDIITTIRI